MNDSISIDRIWLADVAAKLNSELARMGQAIEDEDVLGEVFRDQWLFQRESPPARANEMSPKAKDLVQRLPEDSLMRDMLYRSLIGARPKPPFD